MIFRPLKIDLNAIIKEREAKWNDFFTVSLYI